jgi:hypothetical protein
LRRWAIDDNGASDQVVERNSQFLIAVTSVAGGIQAEVGTFWRVDAAKPDPYASNLNGVAGDDCNSALDRSSDRDIMRIVNAGVKLGHWAAQKSTTWPLE